MTASKAQRRRRHQERARERKALGLPDPRRCHWCGDVVGWRTVVAHNGRSLRVLVGDRGGPDGDVYRDPDGTWRLVHHGDVGMDGALRVRGVEFPRRLYAHDAGRCLLIPYPIDDRETRLERAIREAVEGALA